MTNFPKEVAEHRLFQMAKALSHPVISRSASEVLWLRSFVSRRSSMPLAE